MQFQGNGGADEPRTIEEIERRADEIDEADRAALRTIAAVMREMAVLLPVESQVPMRLARAAKQMEKITSGANPGLWGCSTLDRFIHEHGAALRRYGGSR